MWAHFVDASLARPRLCLGWLFILSIDHFHSRDSTIADLLLGLCPVKILIDLWGIIMGLMGIVVYRPKEGSERKFLSLIKKHAPLLISLGGISDASFLMKSIDGSYIQVFEWKSKAAKKVAMKSEILWDLWGKIEECSTKVKLSSVPEAKEVISNFKSI